MGAQQPKRSDPQSIQLAMYFEAHRMQSWCSEDDWVDTYASTWEWNRECMFMFENVCGSVYMDVVLYFSRPPPRVNFPLKRKTQRGKDQHQILSEPEVQLYTKKKEGKPNKLGRNSHSERGTPKKDNIRR